MAVAQQVTLNEILDGEVCGRSVRMGGHDVGDLPYRFHHSHSRETESSMHERCAPNPLWQQLRSVFTTYGSILLRRCLFQTLVTPVRSQYSWQVSQSIWHPTD